MSTELDRILDAAFQAYDAHQTIESLCQEERPRRRGGGSEDQVERSTQERGYRSAHRLRALTAAQERRIRRSVDRVIDPSRVDRSQSRQTSLGHVSTERGLEELMGQSVGHDRQVMQRGRRLARSMERYLQSARSHLQGSRDESLTPSERRQHAADALIQLRHALSSGRQIQWAMRDRDIDPATQQHLGEFIQATEWRSLGREVFMAARQHGLSVPAGLIQSRE